MRTHSSGSSTLAGVLFAGALIAGIVVTAFLANAAWADTIPAAQHGAALTDWEANEDQGLWVEAANSQWYYANFTATCPSLRLATTLSFDTGATDTFGPSSAVQLPSGARCIVSSLTPSAGPDVSAESSQPVSTDPKLTRQ